jgi:dihydrofolate synthase/folylpolyglutamate synthase
MAFEAFAQEKVDFAVVEVGLGGRLDATNILTPAVSVITRIDFDHENFLGHALRDIAEEKAGILKPGIPAVFARQRAEVCEVLLARAAELHCPVIETSEAFQVRGERLQDGCARAEVLETATGQRMELAPQLRGRFQLQNALNAVAAARVLQERNYRIRSENIVRGIAAAQWPGRIERLQTHPDLYLDGAHNPAAARELASFLEENFPGRKVFLVYAAMRDKAVDEVGGVLFPQVEEVIFTEARTPRAVSAAQLAEIAGHHAKHFTVIASAEEALETVLAKAQAEDCVFVTGSLYLVGQIRQFCKNRKSMTRMGSQE